MKTRLFALFRATSSESFCKDFAAALELKDAQLAEVARSVFDVLFARTEQERKAVIDRISAGTGLSPSQFESALSILQYFGDQLTDKEYAEDTPEGIFEDLKDLGLVSVADREKLTGALAEIKVSALTRGIREKERRKFASGLLPSLAGVGITVELRAVIEPVFKYGGESRDYNPSLKGFIPVASFLVHVDTGTPADFFFQCDEFRLNLLLQHCEAAVRQVELLKKELQLKNLPE